MRPSKSKIFRLSEKDSGFTLLELLVVLVIIGLLTTIVGPQVMKMLGNAKGDVARVQLENIGMLWIYLTWMLGAIQMKRKV